MEFTPYNVLDQIRFVLELLGAEFLFALPFARRRSHFLLRLLAGCGGLSLFSLLYCVWPFQKTLTAAGMPALAMSFSFIAWYVLLTALTGAVLHLCCHLKQAELLYVMTAGYAVQHIEYVLVNELLIDLAVPQIEDMPVLYTALCALTTLILYGILFLLFLARRPRGSDTIFGDSRLIRNMFGIMLGILIAASFTEQTMYEYTVQATGVPVMAALMDVLFCLLFLVTLTAISDIGRLTRDRTLLEQMLDEREHQYRMSAQTIDIINRKCHDLKHQIAALRHVSSAEAEGSLREIEKSVQIYDSVLQTDNDALNTLLTEKKLVCDGRGIALTAMVDGKAIAFMDPIDLYTLLGNALDNAIECELQYPEPVRSISLTIAPRGRMLLIRLSNYYEGTLQLRDGLPSTTKPDRDNHGFGMQSMRAIAEQYHGTLECGKEGETFLLAIVVPLPKETAGSPG